MNSNTSISGWHRHGHGTVQQCRMPELLGIPVSADSRLAGMSSPYNTHTHCQKLPPPPPVWIVSAGAGRFAGVFCRKLCSAHPPGLATGHFLPGTGGRLSSVVSTPSGQLSFQLYSSAIGQLVSLPDSMSQGQVGRGANGRKTVGHHETGRPSGVMPRRASSRTQSSALPLEYTESLRQASSFGLQFPHL